MTVPIIIAALTTILLTVVLTFKRTRNETATKMNTNKIEIEQPIVLTPNQFVEQYKKGQGRVKGGTLCFWGHWFGRPYDNIHEIKLATLDNDTNVLTIRFSEEETLAVTNPTNIKEFATRIEINGADKIFWQWYYYGKTHQKENLLHYNITRVGQIISAENNVSWTKIDWSDLTISKPAVLLT